MGLSGPLIFACDNNGHTYMSAVYSANALAETSSSLFPLCSIQAVFDRCDMDKSGNIDVTELGTLNCNQHNPDSLVVAHCSTWFVPRKEMHAAAGNESN